MKDELIKNFSEGTPALADTFASAAEPNDRTYPAREPRTVYGLPRDLPSLFAGEYSAPASNLPAQVSQAEILAQNEGRGDNMWPASSQESAPSLAGTKVVGSLDAARRQAGGR